MKASYRDVLEAAHPKLPLWWDMHGVPRFVPYAPGLQSIYAREEALLQVSCQGCGRMFEVGVYDDPLVGSDVTREGGLMRSGLEAGQELYYGDPPNVCCRVGATMSSLSRRVIQFWTRGADSAGRWVRRPELELFFPDDPVEML